MIPPERKISVKIFLNYEVRKDVYVQQKKH